jgi:hypothetical protein
MKAGYQAAHITSTSAACFNTLLQQQLEQQLNT